MTKQEFEQATGLMITNNEYEWIEDMYTTAKESNNMDEATFYKHFVDMHLIDKVHSLAGLEKTHKDDLQTIDQLNERVWILEQEGSQISKHFYEFTRKVAILSHQCSLVELNKYIRQTLGNDEYERTIKNA